MEIPPDRLPADVLTRLIEEFVTREGTDYGHDTSTLPQKVEQVRAQLRRRQAVIVWDADSETCNIVTRR